MIDKIKAALLKLIGPYSLTKALQKLACKLGALLVAYLVAQGLPLPGSEAELTAFIYAVLELLRNYIKVRFNVPFI